MQCRLILQQEKKKKQDADCGGWRRRSLVPRCPICDRVTVPECVPCRRCADAVRLAEEPVCKRCGKPLDGERTEFCLDCGKRRHAYCQGKAVFVYQGNIRQSMYRFKYANRREYAAYYARRRQRFIRTGFLKIKSSDRSGAHVPVEKTAARIQSGRDIRAGAWQEAGASRGRRACAPCVEHGAAEGVKWRTKSGKFKNAFQLAADIVKYKKILLVDDIYTTGTTIDTVSEVLRKGGAERIYYICVSIGAGF